MTSKAELSASITNKNGLKEKIHEIHNFIRNSGAGYGMTALKLFNLLYGLQRIEQFNLLDKLNLKRPECEFSYLYKLAVSNDTGKDEKILGLLDDIILDSIRQSSIGSILFYEIPKTVTANIYTQLIIEIQSIANIEKTCNVLLSGKIYEYFIGRDRTAISELGAYYTDRWITKFIFDKLQINKSGTMIDPYGGSGGFTTEYVNYINKTNPDIDWNKEINNIYHYDINEDVIKSAGLELFCLSNGNIIPNSNLKVENSFKNEFENKRFDYIITNPPYGGDKSAKTQEQFKRDKIKNYIKELLKTENDKEVINKRNKQIRFIDELNKIEKIRNDKLQVNKDNCSNRIRKFCRTYQLEAKDKEACSLILLMDLIEIDGICCGVLKEGVFFDNKYSKLREILINNYNVTDIISVPADSFENTTTKTSILIFKNTIEKTTEITFSELLVHKYKDDKFEEDEEGNIIISEYKDDIFDVENSIISTVNIQEIKSKNYSLNYKDYDKKELICSKDFKLVMFNDICSYLSKSKRQASFANDIGIYNFYTSSDIIKKCNEADYNEEVILIGTGGNCCIHYANNNYSCSTDVFRIINNQENNYNSKYIKYLYFILKNLWNEIIFKMNGSTIKHITTKLLSSIQIPIPKSQELIEYWVNKISIPFDRKRANENKLKELKETVKNKIKDITENEDCEEVELGDICEINPKSKVSIKTLENINYIDITSINNEKITNINYLINNFPSRAKRFIIKNDILYSTVRPNLKNYAIFNKNIINPIASTGFTVIRSFLYNHMFIYNLLIDDNNTKYFTSIASGSTYPSINSNDLEKLKIKIPKDKSLITALEPLFKEIEDLEEFIENDEKLFKEYLEELGKEAIVSYDIPATINEIIDEEEKELSKMTIQELKNKCKEIGIKGYAKFKKEELIEIIENHK